MTPRRPTRDSPRQPRLKGPSEALDDGIDTAVARFVEIVDAVRARTSGPLVTAARVLVYGLVIATAVIGVVVLAVIVAVRVLDIAVPGNVWSAYLVGSGISGAAGTLAWTKRLPRPSK